MLISAGFIFLTTMGANEHFRFIFSETVSHYVAKVANTRVVICGDSIGAGIRHWKGGSWPFRSRKLSGNGYTLWQISSQVQRANTNYDPDVIVVFGGTNDAIQIERGLSTLDTVETGVEEILKAADGTSLVLILPPPTKSDSLNVILQDVCLKLRILESHSNVTVINLSALADGTGKLRDEFSVDGVHLSTRGYEEVTALIHRAISENPLDSP